jgi:hypothetical protein
MLLSINMLIWTLNERPYWRKSEHLQEGINECVVIIVCYGLIVVSDFVDPIETVVKKYNGYLIIGIITLVAFVFLVIIIFAIIINAYKSVAERINKYNIKKENKKKNKDK